MPSKTGNCGVSIIDLLLLKLDGLIVPAYFIRPLFFGCRVSEAFSKHFFWTQRSVCFFFFFLSICEMAWWWPDLWSKDGSESWKQVSFGWDRFFHIFIGILTWLYTNINWKRYEKNVGSCRFTFGLNLKSCGGVDEFFPTQIGSTLKIFISIKNRKTKVHPGELTCNLRIRAPLEEENHLNQTIKTSGSMLIFRGVQQLASWFVNGTLSSQRCKSLKLKGIA